MGKPDAAIERLRGLADGDDWPDVADLLAYVAELERDSEIGVDYEEGYPRFAPFTHEIQETVTPDKLNNMMTQWKLDKARVAELEGANEKLRGILADANNKWRHEFDTEVTAAAEKLFKRLAWHETAGAKAAALTGGEKGGG